MLSVVIPSYNEDKVIDQTASVLRELFEKEKISYELVFVDDGSGDATWDHLCRIKQADDHVTAVRFSRNFGKESAIYAGLAAAGGDAVAVMDCDLQHPPATLIEMYRLWEQGYEVVEAVKRSRGEESSFHAACAGLFYKMMSSAVGIDMSRASDFKLMDRKVVKALLSMPEKNAFFRALSSWVGFRSVSVEFDVQERAAGESKWSFRSLVKYAITNISSFTAVPLEMISIGGVILFLFGIVLGIQTLFNFFTGRAVEGFTTVILLIILIGSFLMISLGIIGYYLSRIYDEVKARPRYLIAEILQAGKKEN